jgi:hypothetical protein
MVAVEHPRADCGHAAALTQQCGRCLRWCCPECYAPWTALACGACRAEARDGVPDAPDVPAVPAAAVGTPEPADVRCRDRSRTRGAAGPHRHQERADVRSLAARVADLERRLQELRHKP